MPEKEIQNGNMLLNYTLGTTVSQLFISAGLSYSFHGSMVLTISIKQNLSIYYGVQTLLLLRVYSWLHTSGIPFFSQISLQFQIHSFI